MAARRDNAIEVLLKYFAALRELTGRKEDRLTLNEKATLADVIEELAKKYGDKFTEYALDSRGRLKEHLALLVNGEAVDSEALQTTPVKNHDEIVILPPVGGGSTPRVQA